MYYTPVLGNESLKNVYSDPIFFEKLSSCLLCDDSSTLMVDGYCDPDTFLSNCELGEYNMEKDGEYPEVGSLVYTQVKKCLKCKYKYFLNETY